MDYEEENEIFDILDEDTGNKAGSSGLAALSDLKSSKYYNEAKLLSSPDKAASSTAASSSGSGKTHSAGGGPVLVNSRQRGNPLLQHVRRAPWQYDETILADYVPNVKTGILFLSLKYHSLNPDYIHDRLKLLAKNYELRILLVQIDCPDPHHALKSLTRICLLADMTLMVAWSAEEAGHIVETYKTFESKPADMIMERVDADPHTKVVSACTAVRSINKSDAVTLLSTLGSISKIVKTKLEDLELCPGLGPQKAAKLYTHLHQPFLKTDTPKKPPAKPSTSSDKNS